MSKKIFVICEALAGVLSAISLIGTMVVEAKEAKKQIGCDDNGKEK